MSLFFLIPFIAFAYASVGFGGATGYLAVMSVFGVEKNVMASAALLLNIMVAGIAFMTYYRAGHLRRDLLLPFIITSVPAAFIGGLFKLTDETYSALLYGVLTFVAVRLLFFSQYDTQADESLALPSFWVAAFIGLVIGLLSGMVGIGGGIFLSPVIIYARWGTSKHASAVSALFIVLNSISGLLGRITAGTLIINTFSVSLLPLGIGGALLGSYFGAQQLNNLNLRRALGAITSFAVTNFWWTFIR